MLYRAIKWWSGAYHVYDDDNRIGIVNMRAIRIDGRFDRVVWFAHNHHFFSIKGEFKTRTEAAQAIPRGPIHQSIDAFS